MPFAITCPGCGKALRTATEQPEGKCVECPKCGERFQVTAENQVEARAGPPPAPPKSQRRDTDDDDLPEEKPPRKRRRTGVELAVAGLLLLVGLGVGAYVLFVGGRSAEDKVPPPRYLQMDMFAYVPESDKHVWYIDIERGREAKDLQVQLAIDGVFPNAAKLPTGLRYVCLSNTSGNKEGRGRYLLSYSAPVDFPALIAELKLQPLAGKLSRVYVGEFQSNGWAIFQPTPTKLYVACYLVDNKGAAPSDQLLEELLARDPNKSALSAEVVEGLAEVSGYSSIEGHLAKGLEYARYDGSLLSADNVMERYTVYKFQTDAAAKTWFDQRRKTKSDFANDGRQQTLEDSSWLRGDKAYTFRRTHFGPPPKQ